tara:strand:- start:356 stop:844 length:489 start_codon:yes stop_codon:yes gene_type:complete
MQTTSQQSRSKLEVSHKPNIFFGNYEERLIDWNKIRNYIAVSDDPLKLLSEIFFYCPRTNTKTDSYDKSTWLDGWQLLERNLYNQFDICLLLYYTLILSDSISKNNILIHNCFIAKEKSNNRKFNYIVELNNQFLDTHNMAIMNKTMFDKTYILHYTHDIRK